MSPLQRLIGELEAIPLADMTEQDQRTFQSATGLLRRLSDRVHTLEIREHRQAERVRVLEAKLEKIAGEAPAKEPRDEPSVAWPPSWSTDYRDHVNDMIREAFADGRNRGAWEAGQIADAALKAAP
jgi:hypothetical protein